MTVSQSLKTIGWQMRIVLHGSILKGGYLLAFLSSVISLCMSQCVSVCGVSVCSLVGRRVDWGIPSDRKVDESRLIFLTMGHLVYSRSLEPARLLKMVQHHFLSLRSYNTITPTFLAEDHDTQYNVEDPKLALTCQKSPPNVLANPFWPLGVCSQDQNLPWLEFEAKVPWPSNSFEPLLYLESID